MEIRKKISEIREGFHPTFWVANCMELFERLAYYGQGAILSIFLRDHLHLSIIDSGKLQSIFGGLIYALPILAGTLADKFGFRKAFSIAFVTLTVGYFLVGSTGIAAFSGIYSDLPLFWILVVFLSITAFGGSFIKPSVLGTVAVTAKPKTKSFGFAIYYWLVNIGAGAGPLIAFFVRNKYGIEFVYIVSAVSCLLMVGVNFFFYKEVKGEIPVPVESLGAKLKNLIVVLSNIRFMIFLLIFSLFWIMFWQEYIIIPFYVRDFISADAPFEIVSSSGAWGIIALQLIVNRITRNVSAKKAIAIGFAISSLSWLIVIINPTIYTIIGAIVAFSIGEMTQAPRYYEYISDIAPPGQQGLYQGFAFLPIAIAYAVGGVFGAWLYEQVAVNMKAPNLIWFALFGIGLAATLLMMVYNKFATTERPKS